MTDVANPRQELSPERRRLLELKLRARQAELAGPELRARPRPDGTAPLSASQARLWVVDQMTPGSGAYTASMAVRVRGPLDAEALRRALELIVARHQALRTTFTARDGRPVQVIHPPAPFELPVSDLSRLPENERETELRRLADASAGGGFDLVAGPLFRASLLRLGEADHALLLAMHHIVTDGWSLGVLARELDVAYAALREGREPELPPLPLQYADFAAWEHERLRGPALERLTAFWRQALEAAPPALELSADHPRPPAATHAGHTLHTRIAPALAARLRALARDDDATLFHVLLAAFRVVLSRHAGQDDVVIGSPYANRTRSALEALIGFFVTTVPLRGRVRPEAAFRELVRAEKAGALAAFGHGELPFDRMVEELQVPRDPSRNPVFQVMLTLQNARMDPVRLAGTEVTPIVAQSGASAFDLVLDNWEEDDGGLHVRADFATDVYEAATIERLVGHFVTLLDHAAAAPDARVGELAMTSDEERRELARLSAGPAAGRDPRATLHGLIEAQAARTPDAAAVTFAGRSLTFAGLDASANRIAHLLRARGAGMETPVAVVMERAPETVAALLGILKAGAFYVPVDPDLPAGRVAWMLEDSAARVVLTQARFREMLPPADVVDAVALDEPGVLDSFASSPVPVAGDADALAYVIYTSGSTGRPKGAGNTHRAVVNRILWMQETFGLGADDVVLQKTPLGFDVSVWEWIWPLAAGARLALLAPGAHREPARVSEAIGREGVTTLHFVPSMLQLWLEDPSSAECPSPRRVMSSGEALPVALRDRFFARHPSAGLHNLYGPTEAAVDVTWHPVDGGEGTAGPATIPIGRPVANTRIHVLDAAGGAAPVGVPGELCIAGVQVGRGYWRRPALTAERFVPDPFAARPGARMYRTGDRARWTEARECESAKVRKWNGQADACDGAESTLALSHPRNFALQYLGRIDFQVKIRGVRVEPGEVEAALRAHPAVAECAVVAGPDASGAPRLAAYVVARGGAAADAEALRAHLAARLPDAMVPAVFVPLDALPLTPSGKLDRRALPAPGQAAAPAAYVAPRTETEIALAGTWQELLGGGRVGAHDDFFARGGHSLLATRLTWAVRAAFGVELPLGAVFRAPRLDEMAARIDALRAAGQAGAADAPRPRPRPDGTAPLSFAQQRLWVIERMEPGTGAYNVPTPLRLRGPLDVPALEAALDGLRARHEALRTTFAERAGEPVQVIHPFAAVPLAVDDLSQLAPAEREAQAARRVDADANAAFDLERGPLMRARLLRLGEGDHLLLWCMHHAVTDGWSVGVLRRELAALYAAARRGQADPLPAPALQYADFAAWQHEWLQGERLERAAEFWVRALEGAPPALEIPTDHPRSARPGHRGARAPAVRLPGAVATALRALAREEGTTLLAVLLAAARVVLARAADAGEVVIGTAAAGRTHREMEGVAGFFAHPVPVRVRAGGDPTFRELLRAERDALLDAFAHQELPFEQLVEALRVPRDPARHPVFQATVGLNEGFAAFEMDGVRAGPAPFEFRGAKVEVEIDAAEADGGGLELEVHYAADLFDPATGERLAAQLARVLEQAAAAPGLRRSLVRLDAPGEAARLAAWARASDALPPAETLHGMVAARAARTPHAPALAWDGGALTYAEMEAHASALARRLRRVGIGPERVVGMMLEPSAEGILAILGILKAGGAYLPLDPAHPDARIAHALADSGAVAVVARTADRGRIPRLPVVRVDGVESFAEMAGSAPDDPPPAVVVPDNLAYVIYTSGSTGTPKGVAVAHGPAALHARVAAREYGFGADERCLAFSSLTFDASVEHVFATLAAGACVVPRTELWGPAELAERVERLGITSIHTSNGYWAELTHDDAALATVKRLTRRVATGGEAMRVDAVRAWERAPGDAALVNIYGPTETVVSAAYFTVPASFSDRRPARVPIGAPAPGRELRVLDDALRPVAAGVPGELCIGGVALARGYFRRPALTAERFVPDPFSGVPGARMYRTGDRVRWMCESAKVRECESGPHSREHPRTFALSHSRTAFLEFLGRGDGQVKVRGYRIELGEVEAALRAHPAVADCAADARPDASGSLRVVAYVVARDGTAPDAAALRAHLSARLPEYMVPAAFVAMDALPLTAGGKLDRRALPEPAAGGAAVFVEPEPGDEAALADIWAGLLRVDRVGAEDDFVSLGGHSLLGARVVSRIAARLGVELPLRAVFEAPTVRALARRVAEARAETGSVPAGPIPRADRAAPLPASFAQERMWFLQQLDPQSPAYNVPAALRLRGALDAGALRRALAEVVRRHEVLRTAFREGGDDRGGEGTGEAGPGTGIEQVVLPEDAFGWGFADLSHLPAAQAVDEAMRRARAEAEAPFDLARGPVLRAELVRIAPDDHLLSLAMHHVAGDAWAWEVMNRELAALYAAFRRGAASPLPPLEVQYADFAAWQRGWLRGEVLERQAAYWRRRLEGAPAVLELPTDRPRPAVQDLRGAVHGFRIGADAAEAVRALAVREGATPFMVLLAAFVVVLQRWSGEDDLVVGTPVTSRPRPELEPLVGFFSNTLPVRADLSGRPAFREVLRRVRDTTIDAFAHQDLPFEKMVDEVRAERSLSHTPLFQVMFSLRHAVGTGLALEGVAAEEVLVDTGTSRYDLTVLLSDAADGALDGFVELATALWDEATVARMMRHLGSVVRAATADAGAPIATLPLLDGAERAELVDGFNRDERRWDGALVHHLVAAQAARTPDAVAVEHAGERVTYARLEARANRLAHRLIGLGVAPDTRVAVAMERSVEMVVAVLAVLKAGGCYVAVDPAYPAERIAYMLADSRAAVVLTTSAVAARLPSAEAEAPASAADVVPGEPRQAPGSIAGAGAQVLRVDVEDLASEPADAPRVDLDPENLLYVLYTSGSTGWPKGAALPHRALANVIRWQVERFGDVADEAVVRADNQVGARTLQFASLSFDVSFQEIFSTWASGGTLVLIDDDARRDAEALLAHLREQRVERLFIPFAALQSLAEIAEGHAHLPHLREVITAGEALRSTPQLRAFFRANPRASLDNHYGPSETHAISAHRVDGDPAAWPALPPIGAPVANTRLYVLDAELQPAPIGVPGELYAGGVNLARGYLDRPALTAQKFVPDPFGPAGSRLYRTGDRVRWNGSAVLEYVGRTDFQVKIRGFRVEPGEIEAVLTEHPSVVQAAVTARGEGAERRLAAYVVPAAGASPTVAALRAHVAARLPEHMVPRGWRVMDALPLTPSGKVDRRALPEPDAAPVDDARVEPRTPAEELVADAWESVLGQRPGAHDNFFALGGHSLAATQVIARIRRAFGIELPLRALFEAPTVAGLAARAADARRGTDLHLPPLLPARRGAETPLSFAQQRFWFVERMGAAGAAYNIPLVLTLRGAPDVDALRAALDGLVARHEALRTTFHLRGAEPVQEVAPHLSIDLHLHDLTAFSGDGEAEAEAERIARAEWAAPFDLERGPLVRARLLRISDGEHRLLLTFHHIVCDAWSLAVAFRELGELYAAALEGRPAHLAPLPVQYADYAVWQRERLVGDALARELAYWRARLEGAAVLQLPTDRPRPPVQSFRGALVPFRLGAETAARIGELARAEGATSFMVLLAAFDVLLSRWTGSEDVVVGSPVAGRVPEETEPLVGVFVNTLALRTDLSGEPTFRQVLARVREGTLDAYAHQEVPFERLVEELKVGRSLDRHPLFQVIFSMHAGGYGAPALPDLSVDVAEGDSETSKVDLVLGVTEDASGIDGVFQYASDLFDAATVQRMARHLATLLDAALADPARPIAALPLMTPAEEALLDSFHGAAADHPRHLTLPALFEAQAARTPDAAAVRWNGAATTYAELNAAANRIAHRLRALGVGTEARVAVCMERTPELIAALLAVHKAGGAYVPIDPHYPAERIAYMLADSGAPVLLTHARIAGRLPAHRAATVRVDADWPRIARESPENPGVSVDPRNLAYAIYTSGSTGRPKGVQIEHRGAVTLMHWLREHVSDDERRAVLASTSISFDVSIAEIFGTLCWGGTLVLVRDALALPEVADEVVLASMAPSAAAELLRMRAIPPSVRVLNLGGEALPNALAQGLYALGTVERVGNFYGPTEDTTYSTWSIVERNGSRVYVGRPVANTRAYVLDRHLRRVPLGVPGELYLAGDGLARGYHQRPALTAERFIPDPFATTPGGRMYRVGDLVRWKESAEVRECGSALDPREGQRTHALTHSRTAVLEYLGRLDHQVKIRGHRVETGEIEAVLAEHPRVREAAVVAREDTPGDARLVAYVVAAEAASPPAPAELREHLKARLPEYMVPAAWVAMDALPLNPNGKVDRLRLPAPGERERAQGAEAAPRTAMEQAIAAVWREVLGIEHVGVDENFFEIGGHSLLLARLQERLNEELGSTLTFVDLFQFSTVGALAEHLDPRARDGDDASRDHADATGGEAASAGSTPPTEARERGASRRELIRRGRR